MIMFKEDAGEGAAENNRTPFEKFVKWTPAEYDTEDELTEYGELRFKKLAYVELFSEKYDRTNKYGWREECICWDFRSEPSEHRPDATEFLSMEATNSDFWNNCRINARMAVPDLMTTVNNMEIEFSNVLDFLDCRNFGQDWDQIKDPHEFEAAFANGLNTSGLSVDATDPDYGVLEFRTRRGVKAKFMFE